MAEIHLCKVAVALAGDLRNVVVKTNVSYPEAQLLQFLHGDNAIRELTVTGRADTDVAREKARLKFRYGEITEALYPGFAPAMPLTDPAVTDATKSGEPSLSKRRKKAPAVRALPPEDLTPAPPPSRTQPQAPPSKARI